MFWLKRKSCDEQNISVSSFLDTKFVSSRGLVTTYIEQAQDSGKLAMPAGSLKKNRINRWGLMAKIWARRKQCEFQC